MILHYWDANRILFMYLDGYRGNYQLFLKDTPEPLEFYIDGPAITLELLTSVFSRTLVNSKHHNKDRYFAGLSDSTQEMAKEMAMWMVDNKLTSLKNKEDQALFKMRFW